MRLEDKAKLEDDGEKKGGWAEIIFAGVINLTAHNYSAILHIALN